MSSACSTGRWRVACREPNRRLLGPQTALAHSCTSRMQGPADGALDHILSSSHMLAKGDITKRGLQARQRGAYHTCLQINLATRLAHVYTIHTTLLALRCVPIEDCMKGTPGSGDTRCIGKRFAYLQKGCVFSYARIIDGFHYLSLPRIHYSVMPQRCMHGKCSPPCAACMGSWCITCWAYAS